MCSYRIVCAPASSRSTGRVPYQFPQREILTAASAYLQIVKSRCEGEAVRQQVIATLGVSRICARAANWSACCARALASPQKPSSSRRSPVGVATTSFVAAHRTGAGVRTISERVQVSLVGHRELSLARAIINLAFQSAVIRHRSALTVCGGLSFVRRFARGRTIGSRASMTRSASSLSRDGLARRRTERGSSKIVATSFARRRLKDVVEESLFVQRRNLFNTLDLSVHGDDEPLLRRRGRPERFNVVVFPRDHQPDVYQMILVVLLDGEGRTGLHRDVGLKHCRCW